MTDKALDDSWKGWLKDNLARRCDAEELVGIALRNGFSIGSIRECMGADFPEQSETARQALHAAATGRRFSASGKPRLDDSWRAWVEENLARRSEPAQMVEILLKHDFSPEAIVEAMAPRVPEAARLVEERRPREQITVDHRAISRPRLVRMSSPRLATAGDGKLQLYTLDGFLDATECDALISLINQRLRPSTVTFGDRSYRTSRTCDLSLLDSPVVAAVDEKIARTLGIQREYAEINQGQRYDVGQQFKVHTDYFAPGTDEYREHCSARGNRTWTFMVYLNEGMEGGGTQFPVIDRIFQPKRGRAVIWNNLNPDGTPNPNTLHCGMPVTSGHKVIITQWFRERGNGPMFYGDGEAGASVV